MHDTLVYASAIIGLVFMVMAIKNFQCKHHWQEIKHYTTQSQAQHLAELTNRVPTPSNDLQLDKMSNRKTITILTCQKCGKLNKTVINN